MNGTAAARELYIRSFVRRVEAADDPAAVVHEEGVYGALPSAAGQHGRLLIVDDVAIGFLEGLAPSLPAFGVGVLADAPRCVELLRGAGRAGQQLRAMVCRDVASVPRLPLPAGLTHRPVQRVEDDPVGVPLESATQACVTADAASRLTGPGLAELLRSRAPASTRLFAALDDDGVVRATSGSTVTASECGVIFVSTDRAWRGQGVGTAMTAAAIRAAADLGARSACLEATDAGRSIYARLGFEDAGPITVFIPQ
jgi:GNAT superfamily N-acetyltransferase